MLSNISANSIRRSTIPCGTFSRPNPRSEPLTSIPLSATTSPQKRPPKARHNRRTYHHERRVGSAPFLQTPFAPTSPTTVGLFGNTTTHKSRPKPHDESVTHLPRHSALGGREL